MPERVGLIVEVMGLGREYQPLSKFADIKGGKRLPKGKNLTSIPTKYPYIRVRDLAHSKVLELTSAYQYVDEETRSSISRYTVDADDIINSIVGTIGLLAKVGKTLRGANLTENCAKIVNIKNLDRDFLYYYLLSDIGQLTIDSITVGAVQAKLPLKNIQDIPIPLVPLPEQKRIAAILSALDDKIELNNRMNNNLEEQAQAVFKSWFVDFEPFIDGDFFDSELGKIPVGWRVGKFSELVTVKYGKDHKKLANGSIPVFGSGGIMRFVDTALYNRETVLIPRKGTLNNVLYINRPFWSVDTMFFTEMKGSNLAKFVYFFIKAKDLASLNAGSAVPSMTTDILNALHVVIPSGGVLANFENIVGVQFEQMQVNAMQSSILGNLRDTLLPRLMSGELPVPEIEP